MKIRITSGGYGCRTGEQVELVTKGNTCEVSEEEAKRLVGLGIAEYLPRESVATPPPGKGGNGKGSNRGGKPKKPGAPGKAEDEDPPAPDEDPAPDPDPAAGENGAGDGGEDETGDSAEDDGEDAPDLSGDDIVE